MTLVVNVTALFEVSGSSTPVADTLAVFVNVPGVVARTTMVTTALNSDGHWHVMTLVPVQLPKPPNCVTEMSVAPAGKTSLNVAAAPAVGP